MSDMLKSFGGAAAGFAGWAISYADVDKLIATGAAVGGFLLVWLTIAEKLLKWKRRNKERDQQ